MMMTEEERMTAELGARAALCLRAEDLRPFTVIRSRFAEAETYREMDRQRAASQERITYAA
jgi:hypothetical protein